MEHEKQQLLYRIVGENIRTFRTLARYTQEELATKVGLSRVSMVNIEKGRQHPSLHLLIDICDHLGTSFQQLLPTHAISSLESVLEQSEIDTLPDLAKAKLGSFIKSHHNFESI